MTNNVLCVEKELKYFSGNKQQAELCIDNATVVLWL